MGNSVQELFEDGSYCREEICRIREAWGIKGFDGWDAAFSTLGFMLLYCPEDLSSTVESTLEELSTRQAYHITNKLLDTV